MSNTDQSLINALKTKVDALQSQISSTSVAAGRAADGVALLAVTKTHAITAVAAAYAAGIRHFGENYVPEGSDKVVALQQLVGENSAKWHFIGPLQSNKTRLVAEHFDWVHSIERLKIAQRLSYQRPPDAADLNICLQVNIDDEPSKSGCPASTALELALAVAALPRLRLRGLMVIPAPIAANADASIQRAPFKALAELHAQIKNQLPSHAQAEFDTLSMGMSDDFPQAIAEGATIVRIGSAIFGARPSPSH